MRSRGRGRGQRETSLIVTPAVVLRVAVAVGDSIHRHRNCPAWRWLPGGGVPAMMVTVAVKLAPAATAVGAEMVGVVWLFEMVTTKGGTRLTPRSSRLRCTAQ